MMTNRETEQIKAIVQNLFPTFLHTPTFEEQGKYVNILGALKCEACIDPLSLMLSHRDKHMRILAIKALSNIPSTRIVSILQSLLSDTDDDVREAAFFAIRQLENVN